MFDRQPTAGEDQPHRVRGGQADGDTGGDADQRPGRKGHGFVQHRA